ncbi:MAG TPA: fumarylacetoacetate hydrolase family protein [Candidatus Methylomirabilis sp.]|nr:fumarylacetoacetate hydrolase family protein [Candidatus Methylomirabilis sp.]
MDLQQTIEMIRGAHQRGVYCPMELKGKLTMEQAYRAQLEFLEQRKLVGERQAGWKVGLTAESIRQQVGYHEPIFGALLVSGNKPSGSIFKVSDLITPCFETELCLTVGATLNGPNVTLTQARDAIVAVAPAFELVERRMAFADDPPLAIADNAQQKYFITGTTLSPLPADLALRDAWVEVFINGESVASAGGDAVMGDPAASVAWLANKLSQFGRSLETGMRIMSGSFVRMFPLQPGDRIEARFDPVGTVTARFE